MALKTTQEKLEEVQAAISEVLTSQELHGPNGRIIRARLDFLEAREEKLTRQLARETGSGGPAMNYGLTRRD